MVENYDLELAMNAVRDMDFENLIEWKTELQSGIVTPWIALVLSRLHNLEYLGLDSGLITKDEYVWEVLNSLKREKGQNVPIFRFLKEITFFPNRDWSYSEISDLPLKNGSDVLDLVAPLFTLPSIEKIDMIMPEPYLWDPDSDRWISPLVESNYASASPSLKTIILRHSEAGVKTLGKLLRAAPNLEVLQYDFVQDIDLISYPNCPISRWNKLNEVLKPLRQTLKTLRMSIDWYRSGIVNAESHWIWPEDSWSRRGAIGPLTDFNQLETLELPVHVLLGWDSERAPKLADVLPPNLRELCLRDDGVEWQSYGWMSRKVEEYGGEEFVFDFYGLTGVTCAARLLDHLESFLDQKQQHALQLREVSIFQKKGFCWNFESLERFRLMCKKANIIGKLLVQITYGVRDNSELMHLDMKIDYVFWTRNHPDPPTLPVSDEDVDEQFVQYMVKEVTIHDPSPHFQSQYQGIDQLSQMPSRVFSEFSRDSVGVSFRDQVISSKSDESPIEEY
jgi:hypothetical protein